MLSFLRAPCFMQRLNTTIKATPRRVFTLDHAMVVSLHHDCDFLCTWMTSCSIQINLFRINVWIPSRFVCADLGRSTFALRSARGTMHCWFVLGFAGPSAASAYFLQ